MKPDGWYTGVVHIWQLDKEKIYIDLQENFKKEILTTAKQKAKTWTNLAKILKLKISSSYCVNQIQTFKRGICTKLSFILKLSKFLVENGCPQFSLENIEKHINKLNSGYGSNPILKPKLPFYFNTPEGATLISAILHDGHFGKREVGYSNTNIELRKKIAQIFKKVIGECRLNLKSSWMRFPTVFGKVLKDGLGLVPGPKIQTDPEIPYFILKGDEKSIGEYLRQAFDDEGSVTNSINITLEGKNKSKPPQLLSGISCLLKRIGIEHESPRFLSAKTSSNKIGYIWRINIFGCDSAKLFKKKVGFYLKHKQENLNKLTLKRHKFGQGKAIEELLKVMRNIEQKGIKITSTEIARRTGRKRSHIDKYLKRMVKLKIIRKVKESKSMGRNGWLPAEYEVIK